VPQPVELTSLAMINRALQRMPAPDAAMAELARRHDAVLTKPAGALGRLEELAAWLAAVQRRHPPRLERVRVAVFAGWHGINAHGVSAYPAAVTAQMLANFEAGGAAVNQLARSVGAELRVIAVRAGEPTADFTVAAAMSEAELCEAVRIGAAVVEPGLDLLALGEMGIGNTTAAAAVAALVAGGAAASWCGPGTGLDTEGVRHKAVIIERALALHAAARGDGLEALRRVGGHELAAAAGAILAAGHAGVPVILDGFVIGAAALALHAASARALAHCVAGHRSAEPGHHRLLELLDQRPLLELGMRLGEGSGAALAIPILKAALACHTGMASFAAAGVSGPR
jgi:nicotinate-nucleotide--dimethylbenzimidazole phosphoribosyltransferase